MARHRREATAREQLERAVRNALVWSFVAQAVALVSGRLPWPSVLVCMVSVSYLLEATTHWRTTRSEARARADEAELNAILDAEDAKVLQAA